jgi:hypothetical protein
MIVEAECAEQGEQILTIIYIHAIIILCHNKLLTNGVKRIITRILVIE